ncbi:MAG: hypothetical protein ABJA66_04890 [Actinomycetota bacterium]
MATKKKENPAEAKNVRENVVPAFEINAPPEDFPNELREAFWSVISFEKGEASSLTYPEAEQKIKELEAQGISGLCIVTDEVAARISNKN